jgi:DNA-directed RNA polymerase subunit RPC12/RpoP
MSTAAPNAAAQNQFPCKQCGASLEFAPGTDSLKCPYCGADQRIASVPHVIAELDFLRFVQGLPDGDGVHETLAVKCGKCGAETTLAPDVTAALCPFCGCGIVATAATRKAIRPQGLLPFRITRPQAGDAFKRWVASLWFAPNLLKKQAECSAVSGVYVPAWTYDANTQTDYTGERGDDYWETETYTETDAQGNTVTRTRQVVKTRWSNAYGHVANTFDDLLVMASRTLPQRYLNKLQPWDLPDLLPYSDEYLSGFVAESYQVGLSEGFEAAQAMMQPVIDRTICRDIGGDHQRIHSKNTAYNDITFKHLLLPVWISAYQFRDKTYHFLVNARTGEVQGERPWSAAKIATLVLVIIAVITAIALIAAHR